MRYVFVGQNIIGGCALRALLNADLRPLTVITRLPNDYPNWVTRCAEEVHLPWQTTTDINLDRALTDQLMALHPELILCCGWGTRIRRPLLRLPVHGWVNLHPSYLPAYRGPSPIEWQIANDERFAGGTAHFMDEGIDTGNIIIQDRIRIHRHDNGETLRIRCGEMLGRLAVECMTLLANTPTFTGSSQDALNESYFPRRPDAWEMDCTMSAHDLYNRVRSLSPYPCTVVSFRGQKIRIGQIQIVARKTCEADIGKVVLSREGKLLIGARDKWVKVLTCRIGAQLVDNYRAILPAST